MLRNVSHENEEKLSLLIDQLYNVGEKYVTLLDEQTCIRDLVELIESLELQTAFEFPEGDFSAFKDAVMNGDYDDVSEDTEIGSPSIQDCISDSLHGRCRMFIDMPRCVWNQLVKDACKKSI